jgi:hypothetical protein
MSTAAARMRDYRARQGTGTIVIPVLVCETKLSTALVEAKYLAPNLADEGKRSNTHCSG